MPVRNRLKDVLKTRDNIELTQYRIQKDTGLGAGTARDLLRDDYVPSGKTLETICREYNIQPGEFLVWIPD